MTLAVHRIVHRITAQALLLAAALAGADGVRAQAPSALEGRVLDAVSGAPVSDALVALRAAGVDAQLVLHRAGTDTLGRYAFDGLARGRYVIRIERFGYRDGELEVTLDRAEPLSVSILLEPIAFHLDPLALEGLRQARPSPVLPPPWDGQRAPFASNSGIHGRQQRFLSNDVNQLSAADIRESNMLAEDDVFRAFQSAPGIARRDDFTADLWTRGAAAGQTAVHFDGVPVIGALHALGILSGFNSDMLYGATLQRGVVSASSQAGGAGLIGIESRSPAHGSRARSVSLSPISARATVDGTVSNRVAWAIGARRSHVDLISAVADGLVPGDGELRYAFHDITARADLFLTPRWRVEASAFAQQDRVFGTVADVVRGNEGAWGARVARTSLVGGVSGFTFRSTLGVSDFRASVRTSGSTPAIAVHPPTDSRYRTLLWDTRVLRRTGSGMWSAGVMVRHDSQRYNGPDIDPASLLTPKSLARHGIAQITLAIERARRVQAQQTTRLAAWGERRGNITPSLEYQAGLRLESGDRTADGSFRFAPRIAARYRRPGSPLSISAAYGRTYQYTQSIARTDVLRSGLRASEVMIQADRSISPLRADLLTVGTEMWKGDAWLLGASAWWRGTADVLLSRTAPGPLAEPQSVERASGTAQGIELSVRRPEGSVRGFANYSLSRSRQRIGSREYSAAEDRRHVANIGLVTDVTAGWTAGGAFRFESGAPYTRIIMVAAPCADDTPCERPEVPVMLGPRNAQRGPSFATVDLMTEWTHARASWALSVYAQLRNVLGRTNAVTYHSSCLCGPGGPGDAESPDDRFDAGLPRLPLVGVRVRF